MKYTNKSRQVSSTPSTNTRARKRKRNLSVEEREKTKANLEKNNKKKDYFSKSPTEAPDFDAKEKE